MKTKKNYELLSTKTLAIVSIKFDIPQLGASLVPLRKERSGPSARTHAAKLTVTCEAARARDGVWCLSAACWILHRVNIDRHADSSAASRLPPQQHPPPPITLPSLGVN